VKIYWALLKIQAKMQLQYRAAAVAGICGQLFWGLVSVMIFKAFYKEEIAASPLSLAETITFVWLSQAVWPLLPMRFDKEVEAEIRSGSIVYALTRPLSLYSLIFIKSFAGRLIPTLMCCFPIFIIAGLFLGLEAPVSLTAGFLYGISTILGLFLSATITASVSLSLFWTLSGDGVKRFLPHIVALLSGNLVPLPSWIQPFLALQPFRAIIDIPSRLYTGVIPAGEALFYFAFQIIWICLFVYLGKQLMSKALKRLIIQGG
jgi:ABC-2 type transport system permease protein